MAREGHSSASSASVDPLPSHLPGALELALEIAGCETSRIASFRVCSQIQHDPRKGDVSKDLRHHERRHAEKVMAKHAEEV
eukprot:CAMPEP_0176028720 /NCGR_PEP_ID=MMETSP0120_2-20121206/14101_1 /TAXON_ID=160619 /ORGANISM="Kryptoperidinium foliaceum, Strain CCMP 1326" /LENGTH=80 /DNA_ID=CAMNT_0017361935 /DNA_START=265 /DNA_END=505 /DNA_ORIENTATION=+